MPTEREFLIDQRGERLMMLAGVDKLESRKAFRRQITSAKTISPEPSTSSSTNININDIYPNDNDDVSIDSDCEMYVGKNTPKKPKPKQEDEGSQMRVKLPAVALAYHRFGISDRENRGDFQTECELWILIFF